MAAALFADEEVSNKTLLNVLYPVLFFSMLFLPKRIPGVKFVGAVAKKYPTVIDPSVYAFAVWAPIYLGQLAFVMYQLLPQANQGLCFGRIGPWLVGVYLLSFTWTVTMGKEMLKPACAVIFAFFGCLVAIYTRINTVDGKLFGDTGSIAETRNLVEYLCVYLPFSMYTSWLFAASLISVFSAAGVPPKDCAVAGMLSLVLAAAGAISVLFWTRDIAFACVNIWALLGIWKGRDTKVPGISPVALVCALVVTGFTIFTASAQ